MKAPSLRARIAGLPQARLPAHRRDEDLRRLAERLEHLEALAEGLHDSVHRDSVRHEERVAQLERWKHPEALAEALSDDARRRRL